MPDAENVSLCRIYTGRQADQCCLHVVVPVVVYLDWYLAGGHRL